MSAREALGDVRGAPSGERDEEEVRLHREHDGGAGERRQALGEPPRVVVILGEPRHVVVERVEAGRGEDAGLPHAAAEALAEPARLEDEVLRPGHEGAHRRAEPLREADGDERRVARVHLRRDAGRGGGVPEPRAVHVEVQAAAPRDLAEGADALERVDRAAAAVVRVLDLDDARARVDVVGRPDQLLDGARVEEPALGGDRPRLHAPERSQRAGLERDAVGARVADDLVAGAGEDAERDLVRHRARRDEERRLLPEERGHPLLEPVHARVLAVHVVPDLRPRHRLAHGRGGPRHRVGAKVDELHAISIVRGRGGGGPDASITPPCRPARGAGRPRRRGAAAPPRSWTASSAPCPT
jgi:hypothetical protein